MYIRNVELKNFLIEKKINSIMEEKSIAILMINSKKINYNNKIEIIPLIIERKVKSYILYNYLLEEKLIIGDNFEVENGKCTFSISKDFKILDFEKNLKRKFLNKKIIYIK